MKFSQLAEMNFKKFVLAHKATFKLIDLEECLDSRELINLALKFTSRKVDSVLKNQKLTMLELEALPISILLDWLFKCDHILEVEIGDDLIWVAVDITTNPEKLSLKEFDFKQIQYPLKELGITQSLVVYWDVEMGIVSKAKSYELASSFLDRVEMLIENKKFSGTLIMSNK